MGMDTKTQRLYESDECITNLSIVNNKVCFVYVILILTDLLMVFIGFVLAVQLRAYFIGSFDFAIYYSILPITLFFIMAYAITGLYPSIPLVSVAEIKKIVITTLIVFLSVNTATFFLKERIEFSRFVLVMSWAFITVMVPVGRTVIRMLLSRKIWWGYPVVVIGTDSVGINTVRLLINQPEIGLKPIAIVRTREYIANSHFQNIPILSSIHDISCNKELLRKSVNALIVCGDMDSMCSKKIIDECNVKFHSTFLLPSIDGISSLWLSASDMSGTLVLKFRNKLLDKSRQLIKKTLDILIVILFSPVLLPVFCLISLLIKLDSKGSVFYKQDRVGKSGVIFQMIKFRTMKSNSDDLLKFYLQNNPDEKKYWLERHKIENDPRITRVGHFLRKTSLDELPQFINVIKGEMSVVGPRPIFKEDIEAYDEDYELYKLVYPGITGMWQVSGRNQLTYQQRIKMDTYYVRNWSIWLDIYLMIKTIFTVLLCRGAY